MEMDNALKWAKEWMQKPIRQYINNEWVVGEAGERDCFNPADCSLLSKIPMASVKQVERTTELAHVAFRSKEWKSVSRTQRGDLLRSIARLIRDNMEKLAVLETLPNGKLYVESMVDDIPTCAEIFEYYAGWVDKYYGSTSPVDNNFLNYTLVEPVGVCALIAPWNFPLYQAALKIAPALAMGNTCIIKPASNTPYTAVFLMELIDANLNVPKGVINLLLASGEAANALTTSHNVHKVSFTGSTDVGKTLVRNSGNSNLKAVTLELGGKSPCIFFDDTPDLNAAIDRAYTVMFSQKGEKCSECTRFLIHKNIYNEVVDKLIAKANTVKCGDPFASDSTQGAQCGKGQFENIMRYIEIGKKEAELVAGGDADLNGSNANGYFIRPTIFSNVDRKATIAQEEIFGPVLACTPFETDEEAVEIANDSVFGLAAGLYTGNVSRAHRMAEQLEAGMVFVNRYGCYGLASPFGGYKQSGWGKEMGRHSLASYTKEKAVWIAY